MNNYTNFYLVVSASMMLATLPGLGLELWISHLGLSRFRGMAAYAWCSVWGAVGFYLFVHQLGLLTIFRHMAH